MFSDIEKNKTCTKKVPSIESSSDNINQFALR